MVMIRKRKGHRQPVVRLPRMLLAIVNKDPMCPPTNHSSIVHISVRLVSVLSQSN